MSDAPVPALLPNTVLRHPASCVVGILDASPVIPPGSRGDEIFNGTHRIDTDEKKYTDRKWWGKEMKW